MLTLLLIGCNISINETSYSSINLIGYSDQRFEDVGVFIDPDSTLAKEIISTTIPGIPGQTKDTKTYLIGSGVFRKTTVDEDTKQVIYSKNEIPVLIFFHEGIFQSLRGGDKDTGPIASNGITIMQNNGVIIKSFAITSEQLQFFGDPLLLSSNP